MSNPNENKNNKSQPAAPATKKYYANRNLTLKGGVKVMKDEECPSEFAQELFKLGFVSLEKEPAKEIGAKATPVGRPGSVSAEETPPTKEE